MFCFEDDYRLVNDVVELIPLRAEHEMLLFPASDDPDIWAHFEEKGHGRIPFHEYLNRALQNRSDGVEYPFAIRDLRINEYAGMTRIYAVSNSLKNAKIGHTWIGKKFQRTGLNRNGKYLLFEFLFDEIGMERIGFGASSNNTRSIRAMESIGCSNEGKLRGFLPGGNAGERIDIVLLSVLKSDWEDRVREQLKQIVIPPRETP